MMTNDVGMDLSDAGTAPDARLAGDGNDSFADADPLTDSRVQSAISRPGDLDYYSFPGTAGQWLVIAAAPAEGASEQFDTVITLFDSSMNKIAESDDEIPRTGTSSGIYTHLPQDGTYYILIQDFTTWYEDPEIEPAGEPDFTYDLIIASLSPASATIDPETGNDVENAQTVDYTNDSGLILGTSNGPTDVDVFAFSVTEARALARFVLLPAGPTGMGSTGQPRRIWVENEAGVQIAANTLGDQISLQPNLPAGNYFLFVAAPETMGSNDFYVVKPYRFEDNPAETMDATNNDVATPEPLTFDEATPPEPRWAYVLARLADGDIDHFSITVAGDELVTLACTSRSTGSGIIGLRADLLMANGEPLEPAATSTETDSEGAFLQDIEVPSAGTYVLRLTRTSQDPEISGDWVRCGIRLLPPVEEGL
jgi:hypothetical protein